MDIYLYTTPDEKNKLNKTLNNSVHFEGVLKEETSVIEPSVIIEGSNLSGYNYMYIPQFNRYYFIKDIYSIRNNLWKIQAAVDVLLSFKDGIETCPIVLDVSEVEEIESYIPGEMWQGTVRNKTDVINFPYGLNNSGEYILITSGGGGS